MMTDTQQTPGTRCTCTGGPYVHGPEGLRQALREIAAIRKPEHQRTEGDPDDEE